MTAKLRELARLLAGALISAAVRLSKFRDLALVLAGALISAAVSLLASLPGVNSSAVPALINTSVALLILGLVFLVCPFLAGPIVWRSILEYRKRAYAIGILNDMGWDAGYRQYSSCTGVSPQVWKDAIEKVGLSQAAKLEVRLINRDAVFDKHAAILNPYGGVYPESNLKTQFTMGKTIEYVENGGLFVNIADVPGYYAYSPQLRRRLDITPPIWRMEDTPEGVQVSPVRPFMLTPLMETLGLVVSGTEPFPWQVVGGPVFSKAIGDVGKIEVERVVAVERNVQSLIQPRKLNGTDSTPFFTVPYGNGRFLMSLMYLDRPENELMKDAIANALVQLVTEGGGSSHAA